MGTSLGLNPMLGTGKVARHTKHIWRVTEDHTEAQRQPAGFHVHTPSLAGSPRAGHALYPGVRQPVSPSGEKPSMRGCGAVGEKSWESDKDSLRPGQAQVLCSAGMFTGAYSEAER